MRREKIRNNDRACKLGIIEARGMVGLKTRTNTRPQLSFVRNFTIFGENARALVPPSRESCESFRCCPGEESSTFGGRWKETTGTLKTKTSRVARVRTRQKWEGGGEPGESAFHLLYYGEQIFRWPSVTAFLDFVPALSSVCASTPVLARTPSKTFRGFKSCI